MKTGNSKGSSVTGFAVAVIILAGTAGYVSALSRMFQAPPPLAATASGFEPVDVVESRTVTPELASFQDVLSRRAPAWLINALPGYSSGPAREAWYRSLDKAAERQNFQFGYTSNGDRTYSPTDVGTLRDQNGTMFFGDARSSGGSNTVTSAVTPSVPDAARTWNNTGTDFNAAASWTGGVPGSNDVGLFTTAAVTQPNVTASVTIAGLLFSAGATGYDLTSSSTSTVLTLNGVNTTGSGGTTTASAAAIRNDNTTGTTTIDAPLRLANGTTGISTFFQDAADGSTLIVNGVISESAAGKALSLKNGTFQLNGANTYTGGTSIDAAGTTLVLGNDSALGTGTLTINNASTLQAGGGSRTIANSVVLGADTTISGSNDLTINGSFTGSGAGTRTLTVNNAGTTTLGGNVFLSESNASARTLVIAGTGATTISGTITNNSGANTLASNLTKTGAGILTLSGTNTYTGTTTVNGGALLVNGNQAAATGAVTVNNSGTLGGMGTIGGATTVNGGGTITGATNGSVGTLTLVSNLTFTGVSSGVLATYGVDISGTMSDLLTMTGALNLTNLFDQLTFNGTPDGTSTYLLAHADGGISGVFDFAIVPANYSLVYGTNDLSLVPTAVPEPSTWIGGAAAGLAVLGYRLLGRRRLKALKS